MDDRTNTIAGWVLAGFTTALAASIGAGMYFHTERPEKMGYPIEGVVEEGAAGAVAAVDVATLLPTADAAAGAEQFKKCAACHTIAQGAANGIGPNLWATMGKPHGNVAGFPYTDALKSVPGNWDFKAMDAWLTSPRKYAPGTKMTFAGIGNAQDRANLLVYLNSQGSNLPLPAAPVATVPDTNAEANVEESADTADLADTATPAAGAPSNDPAAAEGSATEAVVD